MTPPSGLEDTTGVTDLLDEIVVREVRSVRTQDTVRMFTRFETGVY